MGLRTGEEMKDALDELFAEYYPGSKRSRRALPDRVAVENNTWDSKPIKKRLPNGDVVEMFPIGALANALGRPIVTIRKWEAAGHIPKAPYRFRKAVVNGKEVPGRRLYTRALIEEAVKAFSRHGLSNKVRIDWSQNHALSVELLSAWREIHERETRTK